MEIRDLGPVFVERDGLATELGTGRLAALLGPLAHRVGETVTTTELIDAIWGDDPPARAGHLLESLIWRLRKHLEPAREVRAESTVLRRDRYGYRLDAAEVGVDSARVRAAAQWLRSADPDAQPDAVLESADAALALWRGEFCAGVPDTGWWGPVRAGLEEIRLGISEARVDGLLALGRPEQALAALDPLLLDQPFRELLWARRMTALYLAGRQADAIATFAEVRGRLVDELGVEPGPELRGLHERILQQDPGLDRRPAGDVTTARTAAPKLPGRRAGLIGRDELLARVAGLLDAAPLVTLVGPGGVGKTRTALEIGYLASGRFPDGVWFIDLSSVADAALAQAALPAAFGIADGSDRPAPEVVTAFLADRRALVLLDNCEHLVQACAELVEAIARDCPMARVLATSREPLLVPGEVVVGVDPLPVGSDGEPSPAAALFAARAGSAIDLRSPGEAADVDRICAAVSGLPLGIELAAAQTGAFTPGEIAEALEASPGALTRLGHGPARQASLLATVDWGHRLARRDEQILHRRLAVVPGEFTIDVATMLCGVPPLRAEQALDLVGGLVHRSLLVASRPAGPGGRSRFVQLVPIRSHADEQLRPEERAELEAVRDAWFGARVRTAPLEGQPGQTAFFDWLDDNAATVRASLDSAIARRPDRAAAFVTGSLVAYWFERGRLAEAARWADLLRTLPDRAELDPVDRAVCEVVVGTMAAFQHRRDDAGPLLLAALPALTAAPPGRSAEVGRVLVLAAAAAWTGDLWAEAGRYVDAALDLTDRAPAAQVRVVATAIGSAIDIFTGDRVAAAAVADQVLRDNRALDNDFAALFAHVTLTLAALRSGDPGAALRSSDELLLIHRRMGTTAVSDTVETRAAIHAALGSSDAAIRCLGASAALNRRVGRSWPWHEVTPGVLELLRRQVDAADFDRHWAGGERLGAGDPAFFTPEWI